MKIISKYKKIIILSTILFVLLLTITYLMVSDVGFVFFKTLSISSISKKSGELSTLVTDYKGKEQKYIEKKDELAKATTDYEKEKSIYDNISGDTLAIIQEATKEEKYLIEYLWISLGNYAKENNLYLDVISSGDGAKQTTTTETPGTPGQTEANTQSNTKTDSNTNANSTSEPSTSNNTSVPAGAVKILVRGTYSDVADFVFAVENDRELKFKLDNISMTAADNNSITATFNVLSLDILK